MHIRLDLGIIMQDGGLLSFFEDLVTLQTQYIYQDLISSETTFDQHSPRSGNKQQREKPSEQVFFEDPDIHPAADILPEDITSNPVSHLIVLSRYPLKQIITSWKKRTSTTTVLCPMVRISMQCPSPPNYDKRSGILIIALNDISLSAGFKRTKPPARFAATNSFAGNSDISDDTILFNAEFGKAVIACSSVGTQVAVTFVSLGPLAHEMDLQDQTPSSTALQPAPLQPRLSIMKPTSNVVPIRAFSVDIPSVHVDISKPTLDALQYWADDVTQFLEDMSSKTNDEMDTEAGDSRDTSLIGSRFFAKSRSGSGSALSASRNDASAETVLKLTVTESNFLAV
jgi:autophagy-related protein 2